MKLRLGYICPATAALRHPDQRPCSDYVCPANAAEKRIAHQAMHWLVYPATTADRRPAQRPRSGYVSRANAADRCLAQRATPWLRLSYHCGRQTSCPTIHSPATSVLPMRPTYVLPNELCLGYVCPATAADIRLAQRPRSGYVYPANVADRRLSQQATPWLMSVLATAADIRLVQWPCSGYVCHATVAVTGVPAQR